MILVLAEKPSVAKTIAAFLKANARNIRSWPPCISL